jgi:hypothetical protein
MELTGHVQYLLFLPCKNALMILAETSKMLANKQAQSREEDVYVERPGP